MPIKASHHKSVTRQCSTSLIGLFVEVITPEMSTAVKPITEANDRYLSSINSVTQVVGNKHRHAAQSSF
jgi:hypothetical protein